MTGRAGPGSKVPMRPHYIALSFMAEDLNGWDGPRRLDQAGLFLRADGDQLFFPLAQKAVGPDAHSGM